MKLNLGSGNTAFPDGYLNLDAKFGDRLYPLAMPVQKAVELELIHPKEVNLATGGFVTSTVDEVRASHVLEHFGHSETLNVLREWVRVLKPGGWLKIAVPDFRKIAEWYLDGRGTKDLPLYSYVMGGQVDGNDYHKAVFDANSLTMQLESVGLVNIQPWTSEIADCASLPVSLNLMGQKPEAPKMTEREQAQVNKNLQALASIINDISTFAAPKTEREKSDCERIPAQVKRQFWEGKLSVDEALEAVKKPAVKPGDLPFVPFPEVDEDRIGKVEIKKPSSSRTQVFASGRWQDLDGEVQCATQEEVDAAQAGQLQTRTIVVGERRAARIALCLSTPRIGFLRPLERLLGVMHGAGVSLFSGDGVFWHHALSRSIRNACKFYFEDSGEGFDFILTADYDTYALPEDLKAIVELLARSPEADCIVPMQMKRGGTGEILAGGQNMNLTQPLVPIETGHFGFTLFRREFFERLPTPWFYEKPDIDGHWGDGRTDADIGFWRQAQKARLNVMLAPHIVIGHGEELITYPRIINGKPAKVYQAVNDWLSARVKPEGIGVQL